MKNKFPKKLAFLSLALSVGIILSYVEYLLPPIFAAVPGIKLGLANTVTVFLLYKQSFRSAAAVSLLRVCLISLLFASPMTLAYRLCGAVLSLLVMCLLKKTSLFQLIGF